MKKLLLILALLPCMAAAQKMSHQMTITVTDRTGNAPRSDINVYIKGETAVIRTLQHGSLTLADVTDTDTVVIDIRPLDYVYEFPASGTRSLDITLKRNGKIASVQRNGNSIVANTYKSMRIPATTLSDSRDSENTIDTSMYNSLAEYLTGRIAGLYISGGPGNYQAYLDGMVPLVVVNGMRMQDFNAANDLVNPNDIKSVSVNRNGAIYGTAGMNGVIEITLK